MTANSRNITTTDCDVASQSVCRDHITLHCNSARNTREQTELTYALSCRIQFYVLLIYVVATAATTIATTAASAIATVATAMIAETTVLYK